MAIIILEGADRSGKSSVAAWYESQGWQVVHLSAPDKKHFSPDYSGPTYFDEYIDMLESNRDKDVVYDRSAFGELIWPQIYGRKSLLTEEEIDMIIEVESTMHCDRILMYDPDSVAHWQRCVDNKEPLTKPQFVKARALYSGMADKYGFVRKTLKDFPDAVQPLPPTLSKNEPVKAVKDAQPSSNEHASPAKGNNAGSNEIKTKEQQKLDKANVINEVLSKRIIKGKGPTHDELERNVRHFLNTELGKIFGNSSVIGSNNEEVELLKFFCKRLKDKETG